MNKIIAFHSNQLCLRGTEVSLYNYAKYNEEILGNKSIILSNPGANMDALPKFKERFEVFVDPWWSYESLLKERSVDFFYTQKMGVNDGYSFESIPSLIHVVFRFNEPHGHRYFYISDWLARDQGYDPETHSLPYICTRLPETPHNLRSELGISGSAIVFGCYGGSTEFNIGFVRRAIVDTVNKGNDIVFLFMNIDRFTDEKNVIFLPGTYDLDYKSRFVNTCDAMIHARDSGETFGLAVSEFAMSNKPVFTYGLSGEAAHIEILGDRGIYYTNYEEVYDMLNNIGGYVRHDDYYKSYDKFNPETIMNKFNYFIS